MITEHLVEWIELEGASSEEAIASRLQEHLNEKGRKGWSLVKLETTVRFSKWLVIWERENALSKAARL